MTASPFRSLRRKPVPKCESDGFTLIEMLVALFIFGLLSAGAILLLSFTLRAQDESRAELKELAGLRRFSAIMTTDLGQIAPRIWRDELGQQHAAFLGSNDISRGFAVMFVRRNAALANEDPRPSLQRVWYYFDGERLQRTSSRNVDGSVTWDTITLMEGVTRFRVRFRTIEGEWRSEWNPVSQTQIPAAVEVVVDSRRWSRLRQIFLVETPK